MTDQYAVTIQSLDFATCLDSSSAATALNAAESSSQSSEHLYKE